MGNLTRIIEQYEAKGVEELLKDKRLWGDLETLKQELEAMEPREQKAIQERFDNLLEALAQNAKKLSEQMQTSLEKREELKKNSEACLSYAKASRASVSEETKG